MRGRCTRLPPSEARADLFGHVPFRQTAPPTRRREIEGGFGSKTRRRHCRVDDRAEEGDRGSGRWVSGHWCSRVAEARHLIEVQSRLRVCMGHRSDTRIVT